MNKYYILLISMMLASTNLFSQSKEYSHTAYFELGGAGLLYSINYELGNFFVKNNRKVNFRIGSSIIPNNPVAYQPIIGATIEWGKKYNVQLSYNFTFPISTAGTDYSSYNTLGVGIIRRPIKGFYFHAKFHAIVSYSSVESWGSIGHISPWISFGLGYTIKH